MLVSNHFNNKHILNDLQGYSIDEACKIIGISRTGLQYYRIGGTYRCTHKGNEYITEKEPILIYRKHWDYDPKGGGIRIYKSAIEKIKRIRKREKKCVICV